MSAGFGISGLIGPLNYINLTADGWTTTNIIIMIGMFVVLPVILNVGLLRLFAYKFKMITANDYKISIE